MKQRIQRSEQEILKMIDEYEKSGFNLKEYCEVSELNEQTFSTWLRKYKRSSEDGFTTIEIVPSKNSALLFAEVNGIRLYKEVSAEYLKSLLS